ncbi:type IV pilus assembly protein PilQ [Deferribacter desulfuricans SSM1]|uniref:Type IV pilus assembly protein PilQ n=1 Tax=Deferribacter desulfuricans (strain DSM 14783 / JCM 11476 / NBRC 101012 / SSM1) TaxID=639282 RepID=D3PDQ0_DEFDS|nr:secretin N-terminal domain-containing protein [Deferribacter desulfuricans]BAI80723.1 type IV pilus assembly protein PilQ [Deferribacter desulfuricans SSM1]
MWTKIKQILLILSISSLLFAADLSKSISVNFKDADIKDVMITLSKLSKINIVLPKNINGKLTLYLENVALKDVIDNIAKQFNLSYDIKNNIIYFYNSGTKNDTAPVVDYFYAPKNIKLADLVKILENFKSDKGKIVVDDYSGTLIITDTKENIEKMKYYISKIDVPIKQVMIEAKIVEVSKTGSRELGLQWSANTNINSTNKYFPNTISIGGDTSGYMVNLPITNPGGTLSLLLGNYSGSFILDAKLQALEQQGLAKIVSQPKIVTMNNKEAKIESGFEFHYKVIDDDDTDVESDEAKLSLTVTPQVTPDNNILLKIVVDKSELDFSKTVDGYPLKFTRKAETYVKLKDGETTVIGGLVQEKQSNSTSAVPGLSKIPLIGWLFKSKTNSHDLNDLVIFITPKIIKE